MKTLTESITVARITQQRVAQIFFSLYNLQGIETIVVLKIILPFVFTSICFCNNIFITYPNRSGFRRCCCFSCRFVLKGTAASVAVTAVSYKARRLAMAVTNVVLHFTSYFIRTFSLLCTFVIIHVCDVRGL
jgi:hypothetical protein